MERREFLAALGTAAAVSSASQVFAQTGGGSSEGQCRCLHRARSQARKRRGGRRVFAPGQGIGRGRTCDDCLVRRSSALMEKAVDLRAQPPSIKMADILASKLAG